LGEFSPIGGLFFEEVFSLGAVFSKIKEVLSPNFRVTIFSGKNHALILTNNWLGHILGDSSKTHLATLPVVLASGR
jgi:hypothetical protein